MTAPEKKVKGGTLELLLSCRDWSFGCSEAVVLAVLGAPPTASVGVAVLMEDMDLGDDECKDLPQPFPTATGLWLLRWSWTPCKDEFGFPSCEYKGGSWSRPEFKDLIRFGVLPSATGAA